ncbi:hypothetical protein BURPS305_7571 [Burkholderia pseudomallei 305]|nr:hypothetical protein BURPS305_7571 [Burkholderia pseudomallei 305]
MVASHAIDCELYSHGMRRISGTKKRQLNAAFLLSQESVKRTGCRANCPKGHQTRATQTETLSRSSS